MMVAARFVQLDYLTRGRAMLGVGPGALVSDALMMGIEPVTQRARMDEALGVIVRLLAGEVVTHHTDWFVCQEAQLQLLPVNGAGTMPLAVASTTSPAGMTGNGPAFSVGGDTDPERAYAGGGGLSPMQEARRIIEDLIDLDKPFLCAVNGHAIGLGATVASLADISFAVPGARFGDAHVLAALPAGNGTAVIWPLLVGINRAKRLLMAGELISTEEAVALGLLSELAPADEVLDRTVAYAERLAALAPRAVRGTKAAINVLLRRVCDASLPLSVALEEAAMGQPEFTEALRALNPTTGPAPG